MEESVDQVADALAAVSGIDCHYLRLAESASHAPGEPGVAPEARRCVICESALAGRAAPIYSDLTHRFAAYQSERLDGRYIYVCPFTLLHVAGPIVRADALTGILVSGPAVLAAVDDSVIRAVRSSHAGALMSEDAVVAWVHSLPRLAPDEATALSEVVARLARTCCDDAGYRPLGTEGPAPSIVAEYLPNLLTMEGDKRSTMRYPLDKEQQLIEMVTAGDRDGAGRVLEEILAVLGEPGPSGLEEFRSRVLELVVLLSRAVIAGGGDVEQVFGLEYRSLVRLRSMQSTREISAWLARILRRFTDLVFDLRHLRYSAHLSRVLRAIHRDCGEPITLGDVADEAGISPGYLSRIFRQEMQTTFSSYVTRVRLQKALRLLVRTRSSVGEIAFQAGFPDQSYFSQVFRRAYGQSPSDYRLTHSNAIAGRERPERDTP